jgi:hypothetical protein
MTAAEVLDVIDNRTLKSRQERRLFGGVLVRISGLGEFATGSGAKVERLSNSQLGRIIATGMRLANGLETIEW